VGDLEGEEDLLAGAFASDHLLVVLVSEGAGEDDDEQGCDGGEAQGRREDEDAGAAWCRVCVAFGVGGNLEHDAGGEIVRGAAGLEGLAQVVF
jgi:hypothetical protein